jgi:CP family cyanate transporter-like MFS transporter
MNSTALPRFSVGTLGILLLLWLAGLYLRVPVLVAPPLASRIGETLGLGQTGIGALTTIPVLMLAVGALPGSAAIARLGARTTLVLALFVVGAGSAARGLAPPTATLFAATAIMGLGIAAMQPALPALLPAWTPGRVALGSAVYMNGMLLGEFIGAGATLPLIMPLAGGDWRMALLLWSIPAWLIAALLLLPRTTREPSPSGPLLWQPDWRNPQVWQLGVLLGGAAVVFFGTNAYMSSVLAARGESDRLAVTLLLFNLSQVIASLLMLALARHWIARRAPVVITAAAGCVGLLAFMQFGGVAALVGAIAVGLASAIQLILLVSLPPQLTDGPGAGRLAAGMFTIGYGIAFLVPLAGGIAADLAGDPTVALLPMVVFAAATIPVALRLRTRASDCATSTR